MQRILTREQMLIGGIYKVVYKETLAQLVILADGTKLQDWIDENPGGGSGPPGPAGTSLVLLGELNSTAELPSTGQELGHCYLIAGDLWSYIASTDPLAVNGFIKAGHISGLSAYEIWLSNGNTGTEEDFLESLNGLSAYEIWLATGNVGTELDFLNSLKGSDGVIGVDGKSAYEIWLAAGNVGTEAVFLNSLKGKSAYQVWLDAGNTGAVEDYLESLEGVSITEATVNGSGNLLITLSTGSVLNAGYVKGADGTSINIQGNLASTAELPDSGQTIGDCYLITGNLWVYTASSEPEAVNGFINAGNIAGPEGRGVTSLTINGSGNLLVTYSDAVQTDLGRVTGRSAYEIAVLEGFVGTRPEWLESLKGLTTSVNGVEQVEGEITLTTTNIADSTDARYVTDAQKTVLENTTGTNTGDENTASIKSKLGISSTSTDGYLTKEDFIIFNNKANTEDFTPLSHVTDNTNPHAVTKAQVGLSNVDNTSDLDKPISSLTQTALDLKADGTIVTAHNTNTSNPHTVTKTQVGLSNVVNTDTTITSNITDSVDKRFITDMQKTVLEHTSGTNTGDETNTTIKTKLGSASTTTDGYVTKEDFTTFTNKVDKSGDTMTGELNLPVIELQTDYIPTGLEPVGSIYYNSENACLSTVLPNGVTLENGQEMHVPILNNTGATITDGSVVYISGAVGNSSSLTGALFIADGTINSSLIAGIATQNILNGEKGKVTCFGLVRGIDTTGAPYGEIWEEDDVIYASPTIAGGITNVAPQAPNLTVILGYVVNKHTNGLLSIKLNSGAKLTDLHDVNGTPLTENGQLMTWDNDRKVFDFTDNLNNYKLSNTVSGTTIDIVDAQNQAYFNNIVINGRTTYDGASLVGVGNDLTLKLTIGVDNAHTDDTEVSIVLPTPLYNTDYFGLYTKELCLSKGIFYNSNKEGLWGIFQNSNVIASYNSEVIEGAYDSSTGALDIGATVVYYENTVHSFIPLDNSEQYKLNTLKQKGSTMYITNVDTATMEIMYNKKSSTIGTICSRIATHVEDSDIHGTYSIIKQTLAEDGYIATYQLTKNGTPLGSKINIPKDYLVKSGTLETCSQNDIPVSGYIIGDKYLDFIVNTTENTGNQTHIYIKVTDLIDIYTEGNGIDITNNSISVVINSISNGLFVNSGGVGLNLATSNSNGAFSSGEKTKLNNIKKSIIAETTASLLTANWVGSVAPYTIDVVLAIPDYTVTSDNDLNIYPIYNSNQTTAQSEMEAYSYLSRGEIISDNTIRFTCYNRKPAVNLNINIEILKTFT